MSKSIFEAVDRRAPELTQAVQQLVRIPSETGSEQAAQTFMAELLKDLGFAVTVVEADRAQVQGHPEFVETPWPYVGRPNVLATLPGAGGSGRSLIFNGHVDVVSPEPVAAWTRVPWGGEIDGDRLFGRGAWDMKGGLLAGVYAALALRDAGVRLAGDLQVHSVIEEEAGGGGGTLACLSAGYTADAMICVEPMWATVVAHPGVLYFRVAVVGRSAHAGRAHTGVNAIGKLNRVYEALVALDEDRAQRARYPLFQETWGRSCHLNVGTYRAGDWASTVPGSAAMEARISFVPGERMEDVRREVEAAIAGAAAGDAWLQEHPPVIEWYGWRAQPWVQNQAHPLVASLQDAAAAVGTPAPIAGKTAGLDCRFAPYFGMAAVSFGPDGGGIHGADEYVSISSLLDCCKALALAAVQYIGVAK